MENVYSRTEPRVMFRAPIWLRAAESSSTIVGETRNLSRGGMFVHVSPTPELGTEVWCELPGRPALRGRVAWVFDPTMAATKELAGVGIEIIDRTADESLVEELVGMRLDDESPIEIRFAGLASPARATGRVTHEGIDLSTPLPFLKLGSGITVGPAGEREALHGQITRVILRKDGDLPMLQISISIQPERVPMALAPPGVDDERWFPEIDIEPMVESAKVQPALAFEKTPLVVVSEVVAEKTERTEIVGTQAPAPSRRPRRIMGPLAVAAACALSGLGLWTAWTRSPVPAQVTEAPKAEEAQVEVTTVPAPPAEEAAAPPVEAKGDPEALNPNARPVAAAEHPAEPAAPSPAPTAAPAPAPTPAPTVTAPVIPAAAPSPPSGWRPQVANTGGVPSVTVPITGGTRGMSSFTMSDPPGYAIDLPRAHTEVPFKSYLLHDPSFTSLWVRPRPAGGLQIRLHTAKGVKVVAESSPEGVRFRRVSSP